MQVDSLRRAALSHERITTYPTTAPPGQLQGGPGQWRLPLSNGVTLSADTLIVAAGAGTGSWAPDLPLSRIRGQLTTLAAPGAGPRVAVAGGGYALPPLDGRVCVGATFDRNSTHEGADAASDRANLESLAQWFPALAERIDDRDTSGHWVGFRSTTPDHMPIAGHKDGRLLLAGMGGKGLVYAPLLAAYITAAISGTPSPLDDDTGNRISPARFTRR